MDYKKAYITLYGAAGAALDSLFHHFMVTQDVCNAEKILKAAIAAVEKQMDEDADNRTGA
ncbi:MAG TPA: hypothetical protein DEQ02_02390 [Ruminococcaceae bacterium]|nr:hypothetical protein [Oscillospiraceae bacterium]